MIIFYWNLKSQKKYTEIKKNREIKKTDKIIIDLSSNDESVPDFLKAQKIVNNAQNDNNAAGWKSFEGSKNRYWLVENLLHNDYKPLRNAKLLIF